MAQASLRGSDGVNKQHFDEDIVAAAEALPHDMKEQIDRLMTEDDTRREPKDATD